MWKRVSWERAAKRGGTTRTCNSTDEQSVDTYLINEWQFYHSPVESGISHSHWLTHAILRTPIWRHSMRCFLPVRGTARMFTWPGKGRKPEVR